MNIIKKKLTKIKNDSFLRIIIELAISTLLFNINIYLGLVLFFLILLEIIISKNVDNLLYIFAFTSINDEILVVDKLNGSISRILLVAIALKLIIYIIKNKIKPNKMQIGIMLFFAISCLISFNSIKEELIIFFNIFVFVLFSMAIKIKNEQLDSFIFKLFVTIITSTLCGIIYGFVSFNFMEYNQGDRIIYRFNGSYEPNFMCLYINIAILSLFAVKDKINKYLFYILNSILIISAILTISVTGLTVLLFSIILYIIFYQKEWRRVLKRTFIFLIITCLLYGGLKIIKYEDIITSHNVTKFSDNENNTTESLNIDQKNTEINNNSNSLDNEKKYSNNALLDRLLRAKELFKNGKIDELTSGRTALIKDFAKASFSRPFLNILFGNNPLNKKVYSSFFDHDCFAHNSYMDFLYNFGIFGFVIIIYFMLCKTIKNSFLNTIITKSIYCKNIKLIRIMLLIFIFTLSMYTQRIFLLFFLL